MSEITAIIMAGGKGTRLSALAPNLPKCLLPIGRGETLLTRLMNQLGEAGVAQKVVCCSLENREAIHEGFGRHEAAAIACENARFGPIPALAEAINAIPAPWYLMCLGDVFFEKALPDLRAEWACCLLTGSTQITGSGFIAAKKELVQSISYQSIAAADGQQIHRWTGAFLFPREIACGLLKSFQGYQHAPFEKWIAAVLDSGAVCGWRDVGEFVNVNAPADYEQLLKSAHANLPASH
jgi:NDP-sugar pyrophosphorylase family protein